jgi:hypothetical protein
MQRGPRDAATPQADAVSSAIWPFAKPNGTMLPVILRGTAVTRLALVGATEPEIATVTGLSLKSVREILDAHYLDRDPALGESAITKLERGTKMPN